MCSVELVKLQVAHIRCAVCFAVACSAAAASLPCSGKKAKSANSGNAFSSAATKMKKAKEEAQKVKDDGSFRQVSTKHNRNVSVLTLTSR